MQSLTTIFSFFNVELCKSELIKFFPSCGYDFDTNTSKRRNNRLHSKAFSSFYFSFQHHHRDILPSIPLFTHIYFIFFLLIFARFLMSFNLYSSCHINFIPAIISLKENWRRRKKFVYIFSSHNLTHICREWHTRRKFLLNPVLHFLCNAVFIKKSFHFQWFDWKSWASTCTFHPWSDSKRKSFCLHYYL